MPVTNAKQIRKITSMCGCSIPEKFQKILNKYENNTQALKKLELHMLLSKLLI